MSARMQKAFILVVGCITVGTLSTAEARRPGQRSVTRPAAAGFKAQQGNGYWQNGYPVGRLRVNYQKAWGRGQTSRSFAEYCAAPAGSHPNAAPIRSVIVSRPAQAQAGNKKQSGGGHMVHVTAQAPIKGYDRTGVPLVDQQAYTRAMGQVHQVHSRHVRESPSTAVRDTLNWMRGQGFTIRGTTRTPVNGR